MSIIFKIINLIITILTSYDEIRDVFPSMGVRVGGERVPHETGIAKRDPGMEHPLTPRQLTFAQRTWGDVYWQSEETVYEVHAAGMSTGFGGADGPIRSYWMSTGSDEPDVLQAQVSALQITNREGDPIFQPYQKGEDRGVLPVQPL
jgi:hypothetical protein